MPRQAHALERISGPARFVWKRRERPRSRRHRQLVDAVRPTGLSLIHA